jgi:hypothetical protein
MRAWSSPRWRLARAVGVASCALALVSPAPSRALAQDDVADRAQQLIQALDLDDARRVLAGADGEDPRVALERARLAIYELDCDGAATILARAEVQAVAGGDALADIAHGCQRVTAALVVDKDVARGIEVRWQDENDRALAPLLFDTVAQARDALSRDLGVDWPRPTRVVVVRDLLSLSAMTGLPYESAKTTGTVAVAKWGRVTLLSPRASHHGYPWRDTVAHELTHLAVTHASRERAPLWLQEGIAKREEVRWRDKGPFDDRPAAEAIVKRGMDRKLTLPLDKLGPSIAMLPSADQAIVVFAEVTSFVRFYAEAEDSAGGGGALPKLLTMLAEPGSTPDSALLAASGADLKAWDERWRAYIAAQPAAPLPPLFGLADPGSDHGYADKLRDLRDRSRLAQLLLSRSHPAAGVDELDHIELARSPVSHEGWQRAMSDPSVRWLRGRALEEAGRRVEGESLVADPRQVLSAYGPWWAMRGRWARLNADEATAVPSFLEGISSDPFDVEAACEATDPESSAAAASRSPLCAAALARHEPPFEGD